MCNENKGGANTCSFTLLKLPQFCLISELLCSITLQRRSFNSLWCRYKKSQNLIVSNSDSKDTRNGARTRTAARPGDFKSPVSTIPPPGRQCNHKTKEEVREEPVFPFLISKNGVSFLKRGFL